MRRLLPLILLALALGAGNAVAQAAFDLGGRRLVAVEGYGMKCAVIFNPSGAMAAAGSSGVSCFEPHMSPAWKGEWRAVEVPRGANIH